MPLLELGAKGAIKGSGSGLHEVRAVSSSFSIIRDRSLNDLQTIVTHLKSKSAHLAATEQPVDMSTAAGKAFFDMLGVFAECGTNLRRERQAEGIAAAKRRGVYRGRIPKINIDAIQTKLAEGCSPTEIARKMGVSRDTVYKAKGQMSSRGEIIERETS